MKITIKFFGLLADISQTTEEQFTFTNNDKSIACLKDEIETKYASLKDINYRIAINQTLSGIEATINPNDIIAFLPPFAGG